MLKTVLTAAVVVATLVSIFGCDFENDDSSVTSADKRGAIQQRPAPNSSTTTEPTNEPQSSEGEPQTAQDQARRSDQDSSATPEEVLRQFFVAMLSGDLKQLQAVALPHDDLALLISSIVDSDAQLERMQKQFESMPFSSLKIGDTVTIPAPGGSRSIVMDESHINENRRQLTFPGNPIPFNVVRTDGKWRVDPGHLIAARKAAQAARQQEQLTKKLPNWTISEADAKTLAKPYKAADFEIRPSSNFTFVKHLVDKNSYYWVGRVRDDKTYCKFFIIDAKLAERDAYDSLEAALKDVLVAIRPRYKDWINSGFEQGKINGIPFIRTQWSGVATSAAHKLWVGRLMHGFVYLTMDGNRVVQILCQDLAPWHVETLIDGKLAALTFRYVAP